MDIDKMVKMYPLLGKLQELGRPLTRENYLELDGWDNPRPDMTAEEEEALPPEFRKAPPVKEPKKPAAKKP